MTNQNVIIITDEEMERELKLEAEMSDKGKTRYFSNISKMKERGAEADTSYGHRLMQGAILPVSQAIDKFLEEAKSGKAGRRHKAVEYLEGMDSKVVAFLAVRRMLDTFSEPNTYYQTVCTKVALDIEFEKKMMTYQEESPDSYRQAKRMVSAHNSRRYCTNVLRHCLNKFCSVEWEPWDATEKFHLGQKICDLVCQNTNMFKTELAYNGGRIANTGAEKKRYVLVPTKETAEWVEKHKETMSTMTPDFLPTIIPPKPWTGAGGGGYYSEELPCLNLVKVNDIEYLRSLDERIRSGQMSDVLKAINALQDTGWSINKTILDTLEWCWEELEGDVAGLPPREGYRLPPCPVCGADITDSAASRVRHPCLDELKERDLAAYKAWVDAAHNIRELNAAIFGQRVQLAKTLSIARKYRNEEVFYYPYQLDFRGRIYAVPAFLTPQGTDVAKGLLQFHEGKPLGDMQAVRWLAIHTANCWGNDKVSFDDRYSWVIQHQSEILKVAENPHDNRWWMEADSPFCFLAACLEWAGYVREGLDFVSHLPIAMDGTCNGLQIFSLMLRDEVGGHAVNLTHTDKPQDIYQIVADKVLDYLKADVESPDKKMDEIVYTKTGHFFYEPRKTALFLLEHGGINRKTTKRQVMVLPYGGTKQSCKEYTEVWLKDKIRHGQITLPEDMNFRGVSFYLSEHIWQAIGETVIKAREAMNFLQDMAVVCNRADKPILWTTPCGLPVRQMYKDVAAKRVKTRMGDSLVYFTLQQELPTIYKSKQQSAISPNYVHSLDASALMKTVCACSKMGIHSFAMIHDSYGTHAADSVALAKTLREVFVQLFGSDENLLQTFLNGILSYIPLEKQKDIPEVPTHGNLDVAGVRDAQFFFA